MYTLVSGSKPGRPWLAVWVTAALMVASTLLAWSLVRARGRPADGPLTQRFAPESWPLVLHLPEGWVQLDGLSADDPPLITFGDAPSGRAQRLLHLTRHQWRGYAPPDTLGVAAATHAARLLSESVVEHPHPILLAPFGALPGAAFMLQASRGPSHACATGSSPDGQNYTLLLRSARQRGQPDLDLVRRLAEAIEITDPVLRDKPDFSKHAIQFDPPSGARFHEHESEALERIGCLSAADSLHPWHIVVSRTWLAGGRTPEQLLHAWVANAKLTHDVRIETVNRPSHTAYRAVLDRDQPRTAQIHEFWCVSLEAGEAALIEGVAGPRDEDALAQACRNLAETIRPGPAPPVVDVATATARGKAVLSEIRTRELGAWWPGAPAEDWYQISILGVPAGFRWATREPITSDGKNGYHIRKTEFLHAPLRHQVIYTQDWFVEASLGADSGKQALEVRQGRSAVHYRSQEKDPPGKQERARQRSFATRDSIEADDTFVCEAALTAAQYITASTPDEGPAIFSVTTFFGYPGETSTMWCNPLGRIPRQDANGSVEAWGLLVRRDFEPACDIIYFGDDGQPVRETWEGGMTLKAATRDKIERHVDDVPRILNDAEKLLKSPE